jgi:hypothetical protein
MKNGLLVLFLLVIGATSLLAQNVYEVYCASYHNGKALKNVHFLLKNNGEVVGDIHSKTGDFQFAIKKGDGDFILEVSKEGYIAKVILFNTDNYPFAHEYEIQEIDIEFSEQQGELIEKQVGEMRWNSISDVFSVVKVDGLPTSDHAVVNDPEERFGLIYAQAIHSADQLFNEGAIGPARGDYQLALLAKPDDTYASGQIKRADSLLALAKNQEDVIDADLIDKINKGEIEHVELKNSDENVIYSVQLGAFSKQVDENDFEKVPEFRAIPYDDYTRCFSGEFRDINLAIQRRKEMVKAGYKDAWIVKMKGNKRLGF